MKGSVSVEGVEQAGHRKEAILWMIGRLSGCEPGFDTEAERVAISHPKDDRE